MGTVYLIHFDQPISHAQHYMGWSSKPMDRVNEHFAGNGAKITKAFASAGIGGELVRTWPGNRAFERTLKDRKNARGLCPKCIDNYNAEAAARMRRYRQRSDMEAFQQRVVDERDELKEKHTKLGEFFDTGIFQGVPKEEQGRLRRQHGIMAEYLAVLNERIAAFV